jgi:hypothetical protein
MLLGLFAAFRICQWLMVIWLMCLLPQADAQGQQFEFRNKRKQQTMDFRLIKNLVIIPVYINHKGPFNFILDTGVSPLLITDPSILDSLDVSKLKPIKLSGLGKGQAIEAYASNSIHVSVGATQMSNMPTAILKTDVFHLSNYLGIHVHGLIGYYFLNSFIVKINYPAHEMKFYSHDTKVKIKGKPLPIELVLNKPYVRLPVMVPNVGLFHAKLLMDSGASFALSLESLDGQKFPLPDSSIKANLGMGFGGLISGNIGRINSMKIGGYLIKHVLTTFPDYEDGAAKVAATGRNGSIGAELLRRFHMTFDYRNSLVYLKSNAALKNAFEHDMSGMEIYMEEGPTDRYFIERIEPGSPAEKIGILPGDEVLGLNFKDMQSMDLEAVVLLLKAGDGKNVVLKLHREGEILFKVLTLKKRI